MEMIEVDVCEELFRCGLYCLHIAVLVVNFDISNTFVLEIP